jgi:hypothetical protein
LKPGTGSVVGRLRLGDGVADLRVGHDLDVGDDEADFARAELVHRRRLGREDAEVEHLVVLLLGHQADLRLRPDDAVDHANDDDDAAVGVEPGVEDQRLERRLAFAAGG